MFTPAIRHPLASLGCDALAVGRFWRYVPERVEGACWLWAGPRDPSGYGILNANGRRMVASRFAWMLRHMRPVPAGHQVCHSCDTPACVNHDHLWVGTPLQNSDDASRKGRLRGGRTVFAHGRSGTANGRAILTEDDVLAIRRAAAIGRVNKEAMARRYGVSGALIGHIIRRRLWRHI